MERSFSEALKQRRTYYSITNQSPISDQEIECIVNMTVRHVPSAFNSQSTRVVLLLGESHKKLWQIVKDALKRIVPAEAFVKTEEKIDHSFALSIILLASFSLEFSSFVQISLVLSRNHFFRFSISVQD